MGLSTIHVCKKATLFFFFFFQIWGNKISFWMCYCYFMSIWQPKWIDKLICFLILMNASMKKSTDWLIQCNFFVGSHGWFPIAGNNCYQIQQQIHDEQHQSKKEKEKGNHQRLSSFQHSGNKTEQKQGRKSIYRRRGCAAISRYNMQSSHRSLPKTKRRI